jgi:redox-sensitive bicupin YhaK (pirin superfamily)
MDGAMIRHHESSRRGRTSIDWLDSRHTFSFGEWHDPDRMGFRALRVINDDRVRAASGFGTHGHRDMEIVTWVLDGVLQHQDSLGNGDAIRPGDVQHMSAGTGIRHGEWNPSPTDGVHFLQMWIEPDREGGRPAWQQKHVPEAERRGRWRRIVDGLGRDGALKMGADASISTALLAPGQEVVYEPEPGRGLWLHVARGDVSAHGQQLTTGDALELEQEPRLVVRANADSELMLFDLA